MRRTLFAAPLVVITACAPPPPASHVKRTRVVRPAPVTPRIEELVEELPPLATDGTHPPVDGTLDAAGGQLGRIVGLQREGRSTRVRFELRDGRATLAWRATIESSPDGHGSELMPCELIAIGAREADCVAPAPAERLVDRDGDPFAVRLRPDAASLEQELETRCDSRTFQPTKIHCNPPPPACNDKPPGWPGCAAK